MTDHSNVVPAFELKRRRARMKLNKLLTFIRQAFHRRRDAILRGDFDKSTYAAPDADPA